MEGDKRNLSFDSDKNPNGALPGEAAPEECEDSLVAVSRVSAAISGLGNLEEILEIGWIPRCSLCTAVRGVLCC